MDSSWFSAGDHCHSTSTARSRAATNACSAARFAPPERKVAYLTVDGQRTGAKRDSITAGVATLERVVAQRYDWRDAGLGATRKRRQGGLFRDEEEDARGKRRR